MCHNLWTVLCKLSILTHNTSIKKIGVFKVKQLCPFSRSLVSCRPMKMIWNIRHYFSALPLSQLCLLVSCSEYFTSNTSTSVQNKYISHSICFHDISSYFQTSQAIIIAKTLPSSFIKFIIYKEYEEKTFNFCRNICDQLKF